MKKIIFLLLVITVVFASCTRSSRTAYDRWANDMREIDRVEDVDNRMSSYEWFYDQWNSIEAYRIQYETDTDADRKMAVKMILNREIGKYNSNSSKYFKAQWKGRGLPDTIEMIK